MLVCVCVKEEVTDLCLFQRVASVSSGIITLICEEIIELSGRQVRSGQVAQRGDFILTLVCEMSRDF